MEKRIFGTVTIDKIYFLNEVVERKENETDFDFLNRAHNCAEKKHNSKLILS